jgi:2-(1,2-epoxy-1,2-dihydrophenyl)acetyl-CoA isomerase
MPEAATATAVQLELRGGVAHLTLNRPDALNTIDLTLARALLDAALRCHAERGLRAVLIRAGGRAFCAGGDLRAMAAAAQGMPAWLKEVTTYLHAAVSHLVRLDAPVIGAVQGSAAGAGLSLVCACDLVLAAESARFTMAYTAAGLVPDGGGTFFLPRIVGLRRALELALTNRALSAREAAELGIVTRVVPDAQLDAEAEALAAQLAQGPTRAFGATKRLMQASFAESLETQLELESRAISAAAATHDGPEGVRAFLERRPPRVRGE